MTLIFQSNKIATRSLGNIDGIVGPRDFSLSSDFGAGLHLVREAGELVPRSFSEVFDFQRNSAAEYIDGEGEYVTVPAGVPRLAHHISALGARGLLMEGERRNAFINPTSPATQTITATQSSTVCMVFWMQGPGSLTVTGDISDEQGDMSAPGISVTVSAGNPGYAFLTGSPGNKCEIHIQVNGAPTFVQAELSIRPWAPSSRIQVSPRRGDILSIDPSIIPTILSGEGDFTIAVGAIDNYAGAFEPLTASSNEARPVITVAQNGSDHLAVSRRVVGPSSRRTTSRIYEGGVQKSTMEMLDGPTARRWTCVMGRGGASMQMAINGVSSPVSTDVGASFRPDEVLIGSPGYWSISGALYGIITRVVIYPRLLSQAEIEQLSTSWL